MVMIRSGLGMKIVMEEKRKGSEKEMEGEELLSVYPRLGSAPLSAPKLDENIWMSVS